MVGRTIQEALEAQHRGRNFTKRKEGGYRPANNKYPVNLKAPDGRTYTAYMDYPMTTNQDANINNEGTSPHVPADAVEYAGWVALDSMLSSSVNWKLQSKNSNSTGYQASSLSSFTDTKQKPINFDSGPFWLDTGASVHISPDPSDFYSLRLIPQRAIKGLGDSSVTAIGIGSIRLSSYGTLQQ